MIHKGKKYKLLQAKPDEESCYKCCFAEDCSNGHPVKGSNECASDDSLYWIPEEPEKPDYSEEMTFIKNQGLIEDLQKYYEEIAVLLHDYKLSLKTN